MQQRSEPKVPRSESGWIPFMQDILSSQPAAYRKGKQLYIARGDKLLQWVRNLEDKYSVWGGAGHSQGAVSSQPGSRGKARAASSVEKELYSYYRLCLFFCTLWSYMFWRFGWSLENFSGHGACGSISAAPGTSWIWWHGDGESTCFHWNQHTAFQSTRLDLKF